MIDIKEAKELVIKAGHELSETGLIARTWGNVGARTGPHSFVITASGKSYETLTEDEVVEVDMNDLSYSGAIAPSSEMKVHREIYLARPDVDFIIHTHQEYATAAGVMGKGHIWFDKDHGSIGPGVLCADYALPGTKSLCKKIGVAVRNASGNAVLMRRHGAVCYGRTYEEAFAVARDLEEGCCAYIKAASPMLREDLDDFGEGDGSRFLTNVQKMEGTRAVMCCDKVVMDYLSMKMDLPAYIDDYAQLIGPSAPFVRDNKEEIMKAAAKYPAVLVDGEGVLCTGKNGDEIAVSMLVRKNCISYFAASSMGKAKKLGVKDAVIMRYVYVSKYSKLEGDLQK